MTELSTVSLISVLRTGYLQLTHKSDGLDSLPFVRTVVVPNANHAFRRH